MSVIFLCIYFVNFIFIINIVCELFDLTPQKILYIGGFYSMLHKHGSWFLMKHAHPPPGALMAC